MTFNSITSIRDVMTVDEATGEVLSPSMPGDEVQGMVRMATDRAPHLDRMGRRYARLQALLDEINERAKRIKDEMESVKSEVLSHMDTANVDRVKMGDYQCTMVPSAKRRTLDTARLKTDGLYDKYSKETTTKPYLQVRKRW